MSKAFASQGDTGDKTISFSEIGRDLYAFTAEGDPNSGVIVGDDSVMIVEAQATPRLARKVIDCARSPTSRSRTSPLPTTTPCASLAPRPTGLARC